MIKLIIVDDEILIREGLKILLSVYKDIEVVGDFSDGEKAYEFCKNNLVHVALMDIRMEKCNGVEATRMIKSIKEEIKIIILTTFKDSEYIVKALSYGASGYLLKDSSSEKIYEAIKGAYSGNVVVNPEIANMMLKENNNNKDIIQNDISGFKLSEKEMEIIKLVAEGLTNKEISDELFLAQGTVKNNISTILSKLDLRDRTQIAIFAFKKGLM